MKMYVKCSTVNIPASVKREFTRLWNLNNGDADAFLRGIDYGYGNMELPRTLSQYSSYDLLDMAQQYADAKVAEQDRKSSRNHYDTEGLIDSYEAAYEEAFADAGYNITCDAEIKSMEGSPSKRKVSLVIHLSPYTEEFGDKIELTSIAIFPNQKFIVSADEKFDNVSSVVDLRITEYDVRAYFCTTYRDMLQSFLSDYFGIPESEWLDYIGATTYDSNANKATIWFGEYSNKSFDFSREIQKRENIKYNMDVKDFVNETWFNNVGLECENMGRTLLTKVLLN